MKMWAWLWARRTPRNFVVIVCLDVILTQIVIVVYIIEHSNDLQATIDTNATQILH